MVRVKRRYSSVAIVLAAVVTAVVLGWLLYRPPALYRVTILPSLGGNVAPFCSLNDSGQVAGVEYIGNNDQHLFLWDREHGIRDLGAVWGSSAEINNAGQICGTMAVEPNRHEGFLWEPGQGRTMLGTLGGKWSAAYGINNRGQIIGLTHSASPSHAFIWEKATGMRRLSGPDATPCIPVSINDAGQVLVTLVERPPSPMRYVLIDPNGPVFLDTGARNIQLLSINNRSCMVGVEEPGGPRAHLVLRDERKTLRRLVPISTDWMTRVNDRNQIAYTNVRRKPLTALEDRYIRPRWPIDIEERVSYLWDPIRGRVPLNRYVRGVKHLIVEDLNNNGCIVGTADMKDGSTRLVLLEPIPERWGK